MSELRFYTFVNFYLSSIQQGVQSFHVLGEMVNKYESVSGFSDSNNFEPYQILNNWMQNHKTLIVLNGGAYTDIVEKYFKLKNLATMLSFSMPFAQFTEDDKSLGGIMTACGCVLPEEIYNAVDYKTAITWNHIADDEDKNSFYFIKEDKMTQYKPGSPEHDLITMLKSCSLAR
jgi:hypothetical protein